MGNLSKSKILAFRQCPRRLWLEIHRPELRADSAATEATFEVGYQVGAIARRLYDPAHAGTLIDVGRDGFTAALAQSARALQKPRPVFEAGFSAAGVLAFADIMLPARKGGKRTWRMVEVKSSTSVKDYHRDDAAIQAHVARRSGIPLSGIAVAHIDSSWVYAGDGDYGGLLQEQDLTEEAFGREGEVKAWVTDAQETARQKAEPNIRTGRHCSTPYECGFAAYCQNKEPQAKYPVSVLPGRAPKAVAGRMESGEINDLRQIEDDLLNPRQLRVKSQTLAGASFFDAKGAAADLAPHKPPTLFLDFETAQMAVPIWKGTRPYQQIPFQFSLHRVSRTGALKHRAFIDLSGNDPSRPIAKALIQECGERGPIFAYSAGFERGRIVDLATRFPRLRRPLLAIADRIVDLLPVARDRYYHPAQEGSWSIKSVLPTIAPDLDYGALEGVQDGSMAMVAYAEAIDPATSLDRKRQIERELLDYCHLDTFAMVRLWQFFTGRSPSPLT